MAGPYPRYHVLDLCRGIAVLAILLTNIWSFGLPEAAYLNPRAYGDLNGSNWWVWLVTTVLVKEKFITIFSVLFGAGIALFAEHALQRQGRVAVLHYRRMVALLLIGIAHAYLLWSGDILSYYALFGMVAFLFIRLRSLPLLVMALVLLAAYYLFSLKFVQSIIAMSAEDLNAMRFDWAPSATELKREIDSTLGSWEQQFIQRKLQNAAMQTLLYSEYSLRLLGQMLLGMALYRSGFLIGRWQARSYWRLAAFGLIIGLLIELHVALKFYAMDFAMEEAYGYNYLWAAAGSQLMALGFLSLFVGWSQSKVLWRLQQLLARAGRMALTLYLFSTLLATTLFYGYGFALFGSLDRTALFGVVLLLWLILLLFAEFWLRRYPQGPLERFWRLCTYGNVRAH